MATFWVPVNCHGMIKDGVRDLYQDVFNHHFIKNLPRIHWGNMSKNRRARMYVFGGRKGFGMKRTQLRASGDINLGLWAAIFDGIYFITVKSLKIRLKRAFSCQKMQLLRKPCSEALQTSFGIHRLRKQNFPIDFRPTFGDRKNQSWSSQEKKIFSYLIKYHTKLC